MNKLSIYGLSVILAAGFAACDDYEEPNPAPQTNPQLPVLATDQVKMEDAVAEGTTFSLKDLSENGGQLTLAKFSAPDLGSTYAYKAVAYISNNNFERSAQVPATVTPDSTNTEFTVTVNPDDLQGVYFANISKGPKTRDIQMRYALYTVTGNQEARIGGPDAWYGPYTISVTPFPSEMVIEQAYYLIGTVNGWSFENGVKLTNSGADPYDDPVFSAAVEVTEGWWWKIVPESVYVTGNWGSGAYSQFGVAENGDDSLSGMLVAMDAAGTEPQAGCLNVTGPYLLIVNMEESTYDFSLAIPQLYTPGNSNGWDQAASQILTTNDFVNYSGYAHLNGEFKFSTQPNWDGVNLGSTGEEGKLTDDGGAGNLNAPADALYWCTVNFPGLTYELTEITTYGLIGDATPNGWDASTPLTPSADFLVWTATVHLGAGEFKFRANDDWDINLGGDMANLTPGGDNMKAPGEEGDYEVTLDLSQVPYTCTVVKK